MDMSAYSLKRVALPEDYQTRERLVERFGYGDGALGINFPKKFTYRAYHNENGIRFGDYARVGPHPTENY